MALALVALFKFDMSVAANKMARDRMGNEVPYKPNRTNLQSYNLEVVSGGVCQTVRLKSEIITSLVVYLNTCEKCTFIWNRNFLGLLVLIWYEIIMQEVLLTP